MDRLVAPQPSMELSDPLRDGPTVSLARLVEDPALRGVDVLAGAAGLSAAVDAVDMVTGDVRNLSPRTLYFLGTDDVAETATVDVVLRRAAAASAAGVLVRRSGASRARRAALPTATLLLSNRLGLPLIDLGPVDPMQVAARLAILRQQSREADYERIDGVVAALLRRWRAGDPAESLLETLDATLGVRCELVPIALDAPGVQGRWSWCASNGRDLSLRQIGDRTEAGCLLYVGDRPRYALHASLGDDPRQAFIARRVLDVVAALLEGELAERHRSWEGRMTFKQDLFQEIFTGGTPRPEVVARAMELGWDFAREHVVTAVRVHPKEGGPDGEPERWIEEYGEWIDRFEKAASARHLWAFAGPLEGRTFAAVFRPSTRGRLDMEAVRQAIVVVQRAVRARSGAVLTAGVGSVASGLEDLGRSYRDALQALSVGSVVHGPGSVATSDGLGLQRHLYPWYLSDQGQTLSASLLAPILELPPVRRQPALQTLAAFLRFGGNVSQVAEAVSVHRNTARYRIRQLEQLLGVDLQDPESRLLLTLALRAHHAARG